MFFYLLTKFIKEPVFILFMIPLICVIASFIPSNMADYTYIQYSVLSVIFGGYVVYYLVSWKSRYQRTLGQLFAGLKLLSAKESELTYRQCLLKILILSLPPVLFVGLLTLKADSVIEIGRAYLLCILYGLLPIYLIATWKIEGLIGVYIPIGNEIT